jgi:hypothetical protein
MKNYFINSDRSLGIGSQIPNMYKSYYQGEGEDSPPPTPPTSPHHAISRDINFAEKSLVGSRVPRSTIEKYGKGLHKYGIYMAKVVQKYGIYMASFIS